MRHPPDKQTGPEGPAHLAAAKQANTRIVPDRWNAERRKAARELEKLASLVTYYRGAPLLAVPIGEFYVRGRWAA